MVPASRRARTRRPGWAPDVGAAVAADLGLVADAAQGDPDEGPTEGAGHGLAQGRLADAGRADEGQDGARAPAAERARGPLGPQLAHGQVLEDAVLHVVESVVVLVEDPRRLAHVQPVLGLDAPRELEHGVEPGADPAVLGVLLARALELVDLALDRLTHRLGQVGRLGPGAVVVGPVLVIRAQLAQLLADGLELAAQQELALRLLHTLLDVGLDPLAEGQVGEHLA